MANPTSFQVDILPLFTERDIHAMSKAFNLASYDDVKAHAAIIYDSNPRNWWGRNASTGTERRRSLASIPHRAVCEMDGGWLSTLKGNGACRLDRTALN
jgi:bifunctional pyridoxal-dependent enzyme with beta-cystathionase and maltose regulon repressor activities